MAVLMKFQTALAIAIVAIGIVHVDATLSAEEQALWDALEVCVVCELVKGTR